MKTIIKKLVGPRLMYEIKGQYRYWKNFSKISTLKKIEYNEEVVKKIKVFQKPNKHIFCGYYDIAPDNPFNSNQILVHVLDKAADVKKTKIDICIADIDTGKLNKITSSKAWCWQMGARARWSKEKDIIYYNDVTNNGYCCKKVNVVNKDIIKEFSMALYDISADEKIGLSINFDRLQRLRPGYGYSNWDDVTINEMNPMQDGLYIVDLENDRKTLLVSFAELAGDLPEAKNHSGYINHISISPNADKAMFFYIWKTDVKPGWKATLWIIDLKTKERKCIESCDQVSHYTWQNNDCLLITGCHNSDKTMFYRCYDISSAEVYEVNDHDLRKDGHPTFSRMKKNMFYSDTYPDEKLRQHFFLYDNQYIEIMALFHDPRMYGEKRCDLHPHYFDSCEAIALDSTFLKNRRSVVVVEMEK